jgi:hypothetical protein
MYSIRRTAARPPKIVRFPRNAPESRLNGATPISALTEAFQMIINSAGQSLVPWRIWVDGINFLYARAEGSGPDRKSDGSSPVPDFLSCLRGSEEAGNHLGRNSSAISVSKLPTRQ